MRLENITLRELIDELSKHEDLMDMEVISLGYCHDDDGWFHTVDLTDYDEHGKRIEKEIFIKCDKLV